MLRLTTTQKNLMCLLAALALLALPAVAQTPASDQILMALKQNGYSIVLQERTWLGRGRVVAMKNGIRREVVFNPGTGEILRDYAQRLVETASAGDARQALDRNAPGLGTTFGLEVGSEAGEAPVAGVVNDPVSLADPQAIGLQVSEAVD